jgi:hypothetical protein
MSIALVVIVIDENPYLYEFLRYYKNIGFDNVFLYDNSPSNVLAWITNDFVKVIHFPGPQQQLPSYGHFLSTFGSQYEYAAFFDADEFLVLRTHRNVHDFLKDHHHTGALGINWAMFGPCGHYRYCPLPVTLRFQERSVQIDPHIKSIVRIADVRFLNNCHFFVCDNGGTIDTNGRVINCPFNPEGPEDVAVLHHYVTKSRDEYLQKISRGRADIPVQRGMELIVIEDCKITKHDTSAWDIYSSSSPSSTQTTTPGV